MTTILIIAAIIVLAVSEILFVVAFFKMKDQIDTLKDKEELITELMKINNKAVEDIYESMNKELGLVDTMVKCTDVYSEQYHTINDTCLKIYSSYNVITDHYKKLLETWEKIDERYDHTYEQFKHACENMDAIIGQANRNFLDIMKEIDDKASLYSHDILVGVADGLDDLKNYISDISKIIKIEFNQALLEEDPDAPDAPDIEVKQTEDTWTNLSQEEKKEFSEELLKHNEKNGGVR